MRVVWSDGEVETLQQLARQGLNLQEISKALGTKTPVQVRHKTDRLRIKLTPVKAAVSRSEAEMLRTANRVPPARYASRTAMMLGDPPLGRSALDQRGQG
jgi:hypothetical protein